jgi:SPP1 gp7 family putative phage head morphogenesis protein
MIRETAAFLIFSEKQSPEFIRAQAALERKLNKLFNDVAKEIDRQIKSSSRGTNIQTITAPIVEAKQDFLIIINEEIKSAPFIPQNLQDKLLEQGKLTSDKLIARMQNKVTKIIETAQAEGLRPVDVVDDLSKVLTGASEAQIKTLARNEMNLANALNQQQSYVEQGVQFHEWFAILDDVTRDSHEDLHGEIVRVGDTFSNGLRYPQDRNGEIEEWINCRCDALPFIPPRGMVPPPGQEQFRESDLVKVQ